MIIMWKVITETMLEEVNGGLVVLSTKSEIVQVSIPPIRFSHKINVSERRYGILTFGAKASITQFLQSGEKVVVKCDDEEFIATVHLTTKGRIDGLTGLISSKTDAIKKRFWVGNTIDCEYNPGTGVLTIF